MPDLVVIHYTAMDSAARACDWLCDPAAQVSAHYVIAADGALVRLVPEEARAWHAGAGSWGSVADVNSRSIGIELDNPGDRPFPAAQMAALADLLAGILRRWAIPPERVIGHSDMAPGRKIDPGPLFDWPGLARQGLSVWPEPADGGAVSPARFRALARRFGYTADVADEVLLAAVRLRFRPGATGPLESRDMDLIADLAARFPVDRITRLA